jgi:glycine/D-amino acid oxidase-like deaminating enzyme/nitrite reductase/ring-hydroxylating ferredoxin subunit
MIQRDGALTSLWQATTTKTKDQYISNRMLLPDEPFDVVIAGGGITGLSTGLVLQEAGFRCVILEANSLCFGTTGGTTAHLNTVLDTPYPTIVKNFGKEKAGLVLRAVEEAIGLVRSNCERYSIDAELEKQTAYLFSQTDDQTKELEEIFMVSKELGVGLEYTDQIPVAIEMQKALAIYDQAKFHPTRYVFGMARAFQAMGGRIIEQCRVTDADNNETITVHTDSGDISCSYLIYATHIPPGVNILNTRCAPYRSYAMAMTLKGEYPDGLIYDMYDPYHYYRTQVIDGKPYLIAGGEDHKTGHLTNTNTCFMKLESYVRAHFAVDEIKYKWSSQYFEPVDGLPYIGHLPGEPGKIFVATGFGGNGMVYSSVAALLFRDLLLKSSEKYVAVFDPNRLKPVAGFSNFVRENADVAKKWAGKFLPAEKLESFADMAPGEGRVVKIEGETLALFKTEEGQLMALAPSCTHMGCHVTWNNMERSWDCPCHGARYAIDGTVLTGPADKDLEKIGLAALVEEK